MKNIIYILLFATINTFSQSYSENVILEKINERRKTINRKPLKFNERLYKLSNTKLKSILNENDIDTNNLERIYFAKMDIKHSSLSSINVKGECLFVHSYIIDSTKTIDDVCDFVVNSWIKRDTKHYTILEDNNSNIGSVSTYIKISEPFNKYKYREVYVLSIFMTDYEMYFKKSRKRKN